MNKKDKVEFTIFLILLSVLVFFLLFRFFLKNIKNYSSVESGKRSERFPTPTPRPIPHGKQVFTVGQSDKTVPQFKEGAIDPYDPAKGGTQTVTINVKNSQPVSKVIAILKTDHAVSQPYFFRLIKGTNTDGQWQGSWRIKDSYFYNYTLVLNAVSNKTASVEIALR